MPKLLLVDDSTFARNQIKRLLGDGYEYIEAADGLNGLEAYFLHQPDLVLLDITMPDMNGLDVLAQLRQLDAGAQVVICSADVQDHSRTRAAELGALAFVSKPVTAEALRAVVESIFSRTGD